MKDGNNQGYKLFHCSECGTIFKCLPVANFDMLTGLTIYTTDCGDGILISDVSQKFMPCYIWICPKCGQSLTDKPINCEDWIAEKVFSIKGDTKTSKPLG